MFKNFQHGFRAMVFSRIAKTLCIVEHPKIMAGYPQAFTQSLWCSGPRTLLSQTPMLSLACTAITHSMPLQTPTPQFPGQGVLLTKIAILLLLLYLSGLDGDGIISFYSSCSKLFIFFLFVPFVPQCPSFVPQMI